ncbi:wsv124 [White spot syndrome virus]|uniref:Wsv124 n=3 Tax=White spot syndrome virus TaxID=342409 RepID=Q8VB64_WSSVS|nr:wsv124 [Shrimp white spot syndrome virus]AFX59501.1 wsv124 [White spot syndrome virus]AAL33128.1 wsv124 [Shrimp white spot syndrome virus]AAL89048.1 WSSV180 [Shrimp white spot syndrome virus]AWQ60312.1 wsv124 [Shrimp white spot syndrome virus]AWQ60725.1 wsv124 [Shrimp white spot syndrome virus]
MTTHCPPSSNSNKNCSSNSNSNNTSSAPHLRRSPPHPTNSTSFYCRVMASQNRPSSLFVSMWIKLRNIMDSWS